MPSIHDDPEKYARRLAWHDYIVNASNMTFNFLSAIVIIWANKCAFLAGFRWSVALTTIHFFFTWIGLELCAVSGFFEKESVGLQKVLPITLAFCGFVTFNNLSLKYNAVSFYQVFKLLTAPTILTIQYTLYGDVLPMNQMMALIPVLLGIAAATATHVSVNVVGLLFAVCGVVTSSFYQVWVKVEQKNLELSAPQLLHHQSRLCCLLLMVLTPLLEDIFQPGGLIEFEWTAASAFWVITSALLSFCVNISIFMVIGKASPITYNVLGNAKLICIIISGYMMFGEVATVRNLVGVVMAVLGIFYFTYLKMTVIQKERMEEVSQASKGDELDAFEEDVKVAATKDK